MNPVSDKRQMSSGFSLPRHVGIIMDGNGRWASARSLPRFEGHRRGVEAVRRTVRAASDLGISYLTLYSFSSENWSRPEQEVSDLLGLLKLFIRNDLSALNKQNVRVRVIGSRDGLAPDLSSLLDEAQDLTADNTGLTLIIAFNYGGRQEIAEAAKQLAMRAVRGEIDPASIDPAAISASLYTAEFPDPDLIIRTSGEQRLSNFLMWQSAYAELVFLPIHWPDFDRTALETALAQYGSRERRFGGVVPRNAMTGS
ncbi:MAG: Isoprenyl transferase [Hyphomicrobiales bacterium]|jgi:undecaprenyl diphosphate synthase|nr:Isoprenyl transferase [Hyphomicrobiales bacterium]